MKDWIQDWYDEEMQKKAAAAKQALGDRIQSILPEQTGYSSGSGSGDGKQACWDAYS